MCSQSVFQITRLVAQPLPARPDLVFKFYKAIYTIYERSEVQLQIRNNLKNLKTLTRTQPELRLHLLFLPADVVIY